MRKSKACLAFLIVLCSAFLLQYTFAQDEEEVQQDKERKIDFQDVQDGRVVIIGKLGVPIGTVVKVKGTWVDPEISDKVTKQSPERRFLVQSINGEAMHEGVSFAERDIVTIPKWDVRSTENRELMVFESCQYQGLPDTAFDHIAPIGQSRQFGLYSNLTILNR